MRTVVVVWDKRYISPQIADRLLQTLKDRQFFAVGIRVADLPERIKFHSLDQLTRMELQEVKQLCEKASREQQ